MVTRIVLLVSAFLALFAVACSSSGDGSTTSPAVQAPTSTAAATRPQAVVEPRSGPPGTSVTVTGQGWPAGVTVDLTTRSGLNPYASALTDANGAFSIQFRIERAPDGSDLQVGRFDLIARSQGAEVGIPFQIETRRPITGPGPGG